MKEKRMRRIAVLEVMLTFLIAGTSFGESFSKILFSTNNLGADRWEYVYTVENKGLQQGINEFTIWFDVDSYDKLTINTPNPPANNWDVIIWQPEPLLDDDGGYDALAKGLSIGVGQSVTGFSVSFNWSGTGLPGPQYYEIIDPGSFETIESGWTVPEPATIMLFVFGFLVLKKNPKNQVRKIMIHKIVRF
jgi:hypothetical protein